VLIIAALQGVGQALFALVNPVLCTFVGATAVGDPSQVGGVLRRAIPWAILTGLLISLTTISLYAFLGEGS
jgi:hypothetical protein